MQGIHANEKIISEDEVIQESIIREYQENQAQPVSWDGFKKLLLAAVALSSSAVIAFAVMIIAYLMITHVFAPRQLHYSMPLYLNLEGNDLTSNISLHSLNQYLEDRQVRDVFLLDQFDDLWSQKPLLSPGQVVDVWLEITVPPEYEKSRPERKYAHVTSILSSYGGRVVGRTSKPIYLNGRPKSALNLIFSPWRWFGIINRYHVINFNLHSGFYERGNYPSIFLATEIKARSAPGPEILDASIHIAIRAGILRKILFYARPQSLIGKTLGFGSVFAILGGVGIILWCFQAYEPGTSAGKIESEQGNSDHASDIDSLGESIDIQGSMEVSTEEITMEHEQSDFGQGIKKRR